MKNKYDVGDLIVDETTGIFGVILGIAYPYGTEYKPYYNVRATADDERRPFEQMMECFWIDNDENIKWKGNYKTLVQQYINYKLVVEDYLRQNKTELYDDMAWLVKQLFN